MNEEYVAMVLSYNKQLLTEGSILKSLTAPFPSPFMDAHPAAAAIPTAQIILNIFIKPFLVYPRASNAHFSPAIKRSDK